MSGITENEKMGLLDGVFTVSNLEQPHPTQTVKDEHCSYGLHMPSP